MVPKISQETLAEMVGTTRSRVSFFMNRFRKMGFIHYAGGEEGGLQVHSSLAEYCSARLAAASAILTPVRISTEICQFAPPTHRSWPP